VGWIHALRTWRGWWRSVLTAAWWGLAGLIVQTAAIAIALVLAIHGRTDAARAWLSWGVFGVCIGLVLTVTSRASKALRN
jgi:hypothetical protein